MPSSLIPLCFVLLASEFGVSAAKPMQTAEAKTAAVSIGAQGQLGQKSRLMRREKKRHSSMDAIFGGSKRSGVAEACPNFVVNDRECDDPNDAGVDSEAACACQCDDPSLCNAMRSVFSNENFGYMSCLFDKDCGCAAAIHSKKAFRQLDTIQDVSTTPSEARTCANFCRRAGTLISDANIANVQCKAAVQISGFGNDGIPNTEPTLTGCSETSDRRICICRNECPNFNVNERGCVDPNDAGVDSEAACECQCGDPDLCNAMRQVFKNENFGYMSSLFSRECGCAAAIHSKKSFRELDRLQDVSTTPNDARTCTNFCERVGQFSGKSVRCIASVEISGFGENGIPDTDPTTSACDDTSDRRICICRGDDGEGEAELLQVAKNITRR